MGSLHLEGNNIGLDHTPHGSVWKYGIQWLMAAGEKCGSGEGEQRSCHGDEE